MFIVKNTSNIVPSGIYQGVVSRIKTKNDDPTTIMIFVSLNTPGYQGTEVVGFCRANWNPPTGRTTANLRQWVTNLGIDVIAGQEETIDLDTLKGRGCSVVIARYTGRNGEERSKITNIFPLNAPVPNPMPAPQPTGIRVGQSGVIQPQVQQPVPAQPEVPPTPAVQPIAINTGAPAPVSTVTAPSPIGVGTATPPQMPNAVAYPQQAQQPAVAPAPQPVQQTQVTGPSEDGFKW